MNRVTAFIFNLSKGGAQGVFVTVVNYLASCGTDIKIAVQSMEDAVHLKELDPSIPICDLKVKDAKHLLPVLKTYIQEQPFDTAIAFSPEIAVNLFLARGILRKDYRIIGRCINTLSMEYSHASGFFRKHVTHNLLKLFYHRIDYAVAQSEGMGKDLIRNYHFRPEQVCVIHNAVGEAFERQLVLPAEAERGDYIVYAGRLEEQKGLFMLIRAFSGLQDRKVGLKIIGSGSLLEKLKAYVKELGVSERVEFIAYTQDIIRYYRKARLCVLSSFFEGFPNVLVEALACGTPVVSYDLPSGPSEIIVSGVNGYLAEYLNTDDLRDKIDKALAEEWDTETVRNTTDSFRRSRILPMYRELIDRCSGPDGGQGV